MARARFGVLGLLVTLALTAGCTETPRLTSQTSRGGQDAGAELDAQVVLAATCLERPPTNGLPADLRPPR